MCRESVFFIEISCTFPKIWLCGKKITGIIYVETSYSIYCRRPSIRKSKHRKHPNNAMIEGRFRIVVPKATTTISNFLTTCVVVDGSYYCIYSWCFKALNYNSMYIVSFTNIYCTIIYSVPKICIHKANIPYYNVYTSFWDTLYI
jgi:hypothetical protein